MSSDHDLARGPREKDPEGVNDWLDDVRRELYPGETTALIEAWYELRVRREAPAGVLRTAAVEGSPNYPRELWDGDEGAHAISTQDWFGRLPYVERVGGDGDATRYRFDDDAGPSPPELSVGGTVVAPDADERQEIRNRALRQTADEYGMPGEPHREAMAPTRPALDRIYDAVIRRGSLPARDAADLYEPPEMAWPEFGVASRNSGKWLREFGRPCLESDAFVGVTVPDRLGESYPFIFEGVDADADLGLESIERADVQAASDAVLDAVDTGGRGAWRDRRRGTLAALRERVVDDGPIDTETLIDEEIDAGAIGYAEASAFWREVARDALASLPGITFENGGTETWGYDHDAALRDVHADRD